MSYMIQSSEDDVKEEINRIDKKINAKEDLEYWVSEKTFFQLVMKAKQMGLDSSEPLYVEATDLFERRLALKISKQDSTILNNAAITMLNGLLDSRS